MKNFHNKIVVVLGLGRSGQGVIKALQAQGAHVYGWDDAAQAREALPSDKVLPENFDWSTAAALVVSPGIPIYGANTHSLVLKAQTASVPLWGDVDLLYVSRPDARYVGITGTNGKSTTTCLIAHLLRQGGVSLSVGGNLGIPAPALPQVPEGGTYVLEMSSYNLDLRHHVVFNVAVFLNLTLDHLERHGTMERYWQAKEQIFAGQSAKDVAIIAIDDDFARQTYQRLKVSSQAQITAVSQQWNEQADVCVNQENWLVYRENATWHQIVHMPTLPTLRGRHNWQNAAAAVAVGLAYGIKPEILKQGLQTFLGVAHRQEHVATWQGIEFVNDSKATNVEATLKALEAFENIYWIAGGRPKGDDIREVLIYREKIKGVFLIGEAAASFNEKLKSDLPTYLCESLEKAIKQATAAAQQAKGGTVLLAPACASWDQFRSYEERGEQFINFVQEMIHGKNG